MKNRQLIWLGGALVLLLVIAFLAGVFDSDFSTVDVPEVEIPADGVTGIRATGPDFDLALERRDGAWHLTQPLEGPADSSVVARLLEDVSALELRSVVSKNPDRYDRYGVDTAATDVTLAWEGGGRSIVVGDERGGSSFVRLGGDEAVYETARSIRLPRSIDRWRDQTILDVAADRIARVSIVGPDRFIVLERGTEQWSLMDAGEQQAADSAAIQRYLDRFSPLRSDGFFDGAPEAGDSTLTVRLELQDGAERRIELTPAGEAYAARTDGEATVFRIRVSSLGQIAPAASELAVE